MVRLPGAASGSALTRTRRTAPLALGASALTPGPKLIWRTNSRPVPVTVRSALRPWMMVFGVTAWMTVAAGAARTVSLARLGLVCPLYWTEMVRVPGAADSAMLTGTRRMVSPTCWTGPAEIPAPAFSTMSLLRLRPFRARVALCPCWTEAGETETSSGNAVWGWITVMPGLGAVGVSCGVVVTCGRTGCTLGVFLNSDSAPGALEGSSPARSARMRIPRHIFMIRLQAHQTAGRSETVTFRTPPGRAGGL